MKKVHNCIKTRSSTQARSHAQKFFLRIKKTMSQTDKNILQLECSNPNTNQDNFSIKYFFELLIGEGKANIKYQNQKLTPNQKEKLLYVVSKFSASDESPFIDYSSSASEENQKNVKINMIPKEKPKKKKLPKIKKPLDNNSDVLDKTLDFSEYDFSMSTLPSAYEDLNKSQEAKSKKATALLKNISNLLKNFTSFNLQIMHSSLIVIYKILFLFVVIRK